MIQWTCVIINRTAAAAAAAFKRAPERGPSNEGGEPADHSPCVEWIGCTIDPRKGMINTCVQILLYKWCICCW